MQKRVISSNLEIKSINGSTLYSFPFQIQIESSLITFSSKLNNSNLKIDLPHIDFVSKKDYGAMLNYLITILGLEKANCPKEEQAWHEEAETFFLIHYYLPIDDLKRKRKFWLGSFDKVDSLRELKKLALEKRDKATDSSVEAVLKLAAIHSSEDSQTLYKKAVYLNTTIVLPYKFDRYEQFKQNMLKNFRDFVDTIEKGFAQIEGSLAGHAELREKHINKILQEANTKFRKKHASLNDVKKSWIKRHFDKLKQQSQNFAHTFHDINQEAHSLLQTSYGKAGISCRKNELNLKDGESLKHSKIEWHRLEDNFDMTRASELMDRLISRMQKKYGYPAVELSNKAEINNLLNNKEDGLIGFYLWANYARDKNDFISLWDICIQITDQFVSEEQSLDLFLRDCDAMYNNVLAVGYEAVYKAISDQLSPIEQRVYQLSYFRQAMIDNRIPLFEPLTMNFLKEMGTSTVGLVILVLILQKDSLWDNKNLSNELKTRWLSYLKFYPFWVEIMQDSDREKYYQETVKPSIRSLSETISEDGSITLGDTIKDESQNDAIYPNMLQAVVLNHNAEKFENWIDSYCTDKQKNILQAYFYNDFNQKEIAQKEGISQQAVAKMLKQGIKRLNEGLTSQGIISTDV